MISNVRKVLFLDIDGVLNSKESMLRNYHAGVHVQGIDEDRTDWPDSIMVERVNRIISETDVEIILSSAWRCIGLNKMQWYFKQWDILKPILEFTPKLYKERGIEILTWLEQTLTGNNVEQFCIIDDDSDMLELVPFLVKTNPEIGIQDTDVMKAIQILNHKETWREYLQNMH